MATLLSLWLVEWSCGLRLVSAIVCAVSEHRACAIAGIGATQLGLPMGPDSHAVLIGHTWRDDDRIFVIGTPGSTAPASALTNEEAVVEVDSPRRHTADLEQAIADRWGVAVGEFVERPLGRVLKLLGGIGIDIAQPLTGDWRDDIIARLASVGARVTPSQISEVWEFCEVVRAQTERQHRGDLVDDRIDVDSFVAAGVLDDELDDAEGA